MTTTKEGLRRAIAAAIEQAEPRPEAIGTRRSIVIERISPELDGGRYPVKRVVGDRLLVTADIFAEGHDLLDAAILLRADDESTWTEAPMRPIDNDRWSGRIELTRNRWHAYAVEAWRDIFGTWRYGLHKKLEASVPVPVELEDVLAQRHLRDAEARLKQAGYAPVCQMLHGTAEDQIASYVAGNGIDLLMMGAYGHSRIRYLIIGSTTTEMIRSCTIPVMLFR